jgi:hypothetical protein
MANKTNGYKDARAVEGMHSVTFYPEAPVFGKSDIEEVPEEHRERCVLVSWPMGGPERVFTESEVRAAILDVIGSGMTREEKCNVLRELHGIVLDPA